MKNWIEYLKENMDSDIWGAIFLDYYIHTKKNKQDFDKSNFIECEIIKLYDNVKNPSNFHKIFLNVCVQLLGTEHNSIIKKTINFLTYFKGRIEDKLFIILISDIYLQYNKFDWSLEFEKELKKAGLSYEKANIKKVGLTIKKDSPIRELKLSDKRLNFLCIATEWFSYHGGLSTFNRHLCKSLVEVGHNVCCLVPTFNVEEYKDAIEYGVTLVQSPTQGGVDKIALLNSRLTLPTGFVPNIIVGHDRITGPAMQRQRDDFFQSAKTILFIHTAPEEIEWFKFAETVKGVSSKAEERGKLQLDLVKNSDLISPVGPKLDKEIRNQIAGLTTKHKVFCFNPGLFEVTSNIVDSDLSPKLQCLLLGRAEDFELKGVDIAAKAMDRVRENWKGKEKPHLVIRGATIGMGDALKLRIEKLCKTDLEVRVKEFNANAEELNEDIRRSSIVLMPSRSEGFGLVGLEAISLRRPILISYNSGLAQLIEEVAPGESTYWSLQTGKSKKTIDEWAKEIEFIFKDRTAAIRRLETLVKAYSNKVSWLKSTKGLIKALS